MSRLAGLGRRLRERVVPGRQQPRLSVVVPVYNVERYLAECLDSVLAQPYTDVEVVLVDDGATDSSGEIAADYCARHPHFHLVRQTNGGLGAARNAGVKAARGEYLTFLDSDDRLPADAWSAMMHTLEQSGSDFAVGKLLRDEGGRRFAMPRMRENHRARRVGVTLAEMPRMLADVFAVNKIFRRAFWDAVGLEFPVATRYEDQPTLTDAFLAARTFDVLPETVYLWRIREDLSSITQRRHDIADLRDRIATKRSSTAAVLAQVPELATVWFTDVLPVDMWEYFRAAPTASSEYWTLLRDAMEDLWERHGVPFHQALVPVQHRAMGWYVVHDRREDLQAVVAFLDDHPDGIPLEVVGDHVVARLPGHEDPTVPPEVFRLGAHEHRLEARLTSTEVVGEHLVLDGVAVLRNVPTGGLPTTLTAQVTDSGGAVHVVGVEPLRQSAIGRWAGRSADEVADSGFRLHVPAGELAAAAASPGATTWTVGLERRVGEIRASGPVTSWSPGAVGPHWYDVGGVQARVVVRDGQVALEARSKPGR